jgi:peroxiredoxin
MGNLLPISLSMLWLVVLVNLALTLRVIRWLRATIDDRAKQQKEERRPDLVLGAPAPEFKARTLAGQRVTLDSYAGRSVAFIFASPLCVHCRYQMPMITKVAPLAKKNADVEMVIVSDSDAVETQNWINTMRAEDRLDMTLPVLVAPRRTSDFQMDYNPRGVYPFFCLIDRQGVVQARDWVSGLEWKKLQRAWEGLTKLSPCSLNSFDSYTR